MNLVKYKLGPILGQISLYASKDNFIFVISGSNYCRNNKLEFEKVLEILIIIRDIYQTSMCVIEQRNWCENKNNM